MMLIIVRDYLNERAHPRMDAALKAMIAKGQKLTFKVPPGTTSVVLSWRHSGAGSKPKFKSGLGIRPPPKFATFVNV